ncbi:hypothetical protein V2W45_882491 [Cenococcum geophilum]
MERGGKRPLEEFPPHLEPPSKKHQPALPDGTATGPLQSRDAQENSTPEALEASSSHSDQITHTISSVSHQFDTTADPDLCLLSLPEELLLNCIGFLTNSTGLHSLCLTSKLLGRIASPVLYRNIKLTERPTQFLLRTLLTRPDLSLEIRYLTFVDIKRIFERPKMTSHEFQLLNRAVRDIHKELNTITAGHVDGAWLTMLLIRLPRLQIFDITITPNFQESFVHNLFTTACNPSSAYGQLFTTLRKVIMRVPLSSRVAYPLQCFARLPHLQTLVSVGFHSSDFLIETSKIPSPQLTIKHVILKNGQVSFRVHEWFRSFKCLESVTIQNWQGCCNDYRPIGAILQNQQNALKQICLAYFARYLEPPNWRSIHPIGSLRHFEKLSRLMVPEYMLLGRNNYPPPVLVDILPQSLESIHITEWIGPHRDQIQCFHASCPQQFPNLREVHIWDCHRPFKKGTKEAFDKVGIRFCRHSGSFVVDLE